MAFEKTVARVRADLDDTFDQLDAFFDCSVELRQYHPSEGEWCMDEILEHITLTNHFLMMTLAQSLSKVLRRAKTQAIPQGESDLDKVAVISDPDAFGWLRPEHMEPTRARSSEEVRHLMSKQAHECVEMLDQMGQGEGALHRVRMSVQGLGKLDMYEWLYFLVQHARRHLVEMQRIQRQYEVQSRNSAI